MQTNPQEYVQQMNRIIAEVKKAVVGKDVLIAKILLAGKRKRIDGGHAGGWKDDHGTGIFQSPFALL